ncbi:DUF4230 domain-containing protein [Pseudochryseolinea flava]|uniref:DUF4230 domain-containing protein n=1 Tax=Pseudochryseolinea flava TaxID=2059302 RepID=A0A364Y6Z6_9BACT|nr:DUF4230 domain-containing protein [Pseudochryseolinea flava]RAW02831.1 hypothetical protein DQQ10_01605 [Pseudochryseolinea flava]
MFSNRKIILLIILLITICCTAYFIVVYVPASLARKSYDGAKEIGKDIRDLFHFTPEVKVNNTVVLQQQTPILELATINQTFQHRHEWMNTWMKSTKKITITGTMEAKAGFDLNQKFSIDIRDDKAYVTLPRAKLLSIESKGDIVFKDENGIWNWVDAADRSKAINAFTNSARDYAANANFIQESQKQVVDKLTQILQAHGKTVIIQFDDMPATTPGPFIEQ